MVREHPARGPPPRARARVADARRPTSARVPSRDGRRRVFRVAHENVDAAGATRRGDDDACARSSTPRRPHGPTRRARRVGVGVPATSRPAFPARVDARFREREPYFSPGRATRPLARRDFEPRLTFSVLLLPTTPPPSTAQADQRDRISPHRPSQGCVGEDQEVLSGSVQAVLAPLRFPGQMTPTRRRSWSSPSPGLLVQDI